MFCQSFKGHKKVSNESLKSAFEIYSRFVTKIYNYYFKNGFKKYFVLYIFVNIIYGVRFVALVKKGFQFFRRNKLSKSLLLSSFYIFSFFILLSYIARNRGL